MSTLDFLGKKKEKQTEEILEQIRLKQDEIRKRLEYLESNLSIKKPIPEQQKVIDKLLIEIYKNWKAVETENPKTSKQKPKGI